MCTLLVSKIIIAFLAPESIVWCIHKNLFVQNQTFFEFPGTSVEICSKKGKFKKTESGVFVVWLIEGRYPWPNLNISNIKSLSLSRLSIFFPPSPQCILLIQWKYPSRSEHLHGKSATNIGTFLKGKIMILHKKMTYCLLDILRHLCTIKC